MSAYVVNKVHVDLLIRAALHYGRRSGEIGCGSGFRWWRVSEDGSYAGWREVDERAESYVGTRDSERFEYVAPSVAGQLLVSENVASVAYRYDDCDPDAGDLPGPCDAYYMGPYVYRDPGYVLEPGEVFAAIDCLDYQSCEHPGWLTSEAFSFLRFLRETVCRHVEGYSHREWNESDVAIRSGKVKS